MTISISELLKTHPLRRNDSYCLYLLHHPDRYRAFGYVGSYTTPDDVESLVRHANRNPDVYGIWVTVESGDGTKDVDVFKMMKGSV